jgi:hypothetical protein
MLKITGPCDGEKCHMFFLRVSIDLNLGTKHCGSTYMVD